jgi:hypothetical protein
MNEPYLAVYISNDTLFFAKKIPSEHKPRDILELSIEEVISNEFDEASRKLGNTVLGILRLWHPDILNSWGTDSLGSGNESQITNDFDVAMHLISKSISDKTKAYVPAIDTLLREQSLRTKAGHDFFNDSWPTIQNRLKKFI